MIFLANNPKKKIYKLSLNFYIGEAVNIKKTFSVFTALIVAFLLLASISFAQEKNPVKLYLFYGAECPHCAREKPFLGMLEGKYPELEVVQYEVWHNSENADLFVKLSGKCNVEVSGVPTVFIGEDVITGYDNEAGKGLEIESKVVNCINNGCIDTMTKLLGDGNCTQPVQNTTITVPILGKVDASAISLPMLTAILGLADGFNACAMFVLLILVSILLRTQSRKRMALVAGIFLFMSGLVYFLFMTVWLKAFSFLGNIGVVFLIVGVIALLVGLINIKDFFLFGKGPSLKISDKAKKGIFEKMRDIANAEKLYFMIASVIVLAVSVNFVEFLCTFGFPMVFTSVLASSGIPEFMKYFYIFLYQVFYMLDDAIIVIIAIATLSSKKLTEDYGRILKLVAGILMLALGLILLINPRLLMLG